MAFNVIYFDLGGTLLNRGPGSGADSLANSTLLPRCADILMGLSMLPNVVMGIISDLDAEYVPLIERVLNTLNISRYFAPPLVFFSGIVGSNKSSRKIFQKAKSTALSLYPGATLYFVDDEPSNLDRAGSVGFTTFSSPLEFADKFDIRPSDANDPDSVIKSWRKILLRSEIDVLTSAITIEAYRDLFVALRNAGSGNRHIAGPNIQRFTRYLAAKLQECGSERQPGFNFTASITEPFSHEGLSLSNVVGEIEGESKDIILLGAHFDSTSQSSSPGHYDPRRQPAPGADDNLSGVISVLLSARAFCKLFADRKPMYTLQFAFFNAEEEGLIGSDIYANSLQRQGKRVVAAFTNDMIGYRKKKDNYSVEIHTHTAESNNTAKYSATLGEHISSIVGYLIDQKVIPDLKLFKYYDENDPASGRSDHSSFHKFGWPAMVLSEQFFSDEENPNYHKVTDIKIDIPYATNNTRLLFAAASAAVNKEAAIIADTGADDNNANTHVDGNVIRDPNGAAGLNFKITCFFDGKHTPVHCDTNAKGEFASDFNLPKTATGNMRMVMESSEGSVMHRTYIDKFFAGSARASMDITFVPNAFPKLTERYVNVGKADILEEMFDTLTFEELKEFVMKKKVATEKLEKWKAIGHLPNLENNISRYRFAKEIATLRGFADVDEVYKQYLRKVRRLYPNPKEIGDFLYYFDAAGQEKEFTESAQILEPITRKPLATIPPNGTTKAVRVVGYWLQKSLDFYTKVIGFDNPARDRKIPVLVLDPAKINDINNEDWGYGFATPMFFQIDRGLANDPKCAVSVHELFHMVQYGYYETLTSADDWENSITEGGATILEDGVEKSLKRYLDESLSNFNMNGKPGLLLNPNWDIPSSSYKASLLLRYITEQRANFSPDTIGAFAYKSMLEYFRRQGELRVNTMEEAIKYLPWHSIELVDRTVITINNKSYPKVNETTIGNFALALILKNFIDSHGDKRFGFADNNASIGISQVIESQKPNDQTYNNYSAPASTLQIGRRYSSQVNRLGTRFYKFQRNQITNITVLFKTVSAITLQVVLLTSGNKIVNIFRRNDSMISQDLYLPDEVSTVYVAVTGREDKTSQFDLQIKDAGAASSHLFITNWNSAPDKWYHVDPYNGTWNWTSPDIAYSQTDRTITVTVRNQGNAATGKITVTAYSVSGNDTVQQINTVEAPALQAKSTDKITIPIIGDLPNGVIAIVAEDGTRRVAAFTSVTGTAAFSRAFKSSGGGGAITTTTAATTTSLTTTTSYAMPRMAASGGDGGPPDGGGDDDEDRFTFSYASNAQVASWFLGPRGENVEFLLKVFTRALENHVKWRKQYFPEDPDVINNKLTDNPAFKESHQLIESEVERLSELLKNSMPFFSPRYKGHMSYEPSIPSMVGYFTGMLYNNNNVAAEGAPVTTELELQVGLQLSEMLGYNVKKPQDVKSSTEKSAWGHITSGGSVANIESLWAARSVRFLALAIKKTLTQPDCVFASLKDTLEVITCDGKTVKVVNADEWVLINATCDEQLNLLTKITKDLTDDNKKKAIAQIGANDVQRLGLPDGKPAKYFVPINRHYSWDKAGALLGIGQSNMVTVDIGDHFRQNLDDLRKKLTDCLNNKIPVLQVMGLIGSTGEGAVDDLAGILKLREEFRQKGLDFYVHADAAWGGYFASMVDRKTNSAPTKTSVKAKALFVVASSSRRTPAIPLSDHVLKQLLHALPHTDSITIDPHKAGYVQYPAGALCYRNGEILSLIQFNAEYLFNRNDSSMGLYGIEGSKPGAAASAVWLQHRIIPLTPKGHGHLCGQANWTTKRLYCVLATLAESDDPFKIVMGVPVPPGVSFEDMKQIACKTNKEIVNDPRLMEVMKKIGPDLLINVFVVNFKWPLLRDAGVQEWNTSLKLANDVTEAIAADLNMAYTSNTDDTTTQQGASRKALFLIRNSLSLQLPPANDMAKRLLPEGKFDAEKIGYLVNTNMDPWATSAGFFETFRFELRQSILRSVGKVKEPRHFHAFAVCDIQSEDEVYGDHLPVFTESVHNYHLVLKIKIVDEKVKLQDFITQVKPNETLLIANDEIADKPERNRKQLFELIHGGEFDAIAVAGFPQEPRVLSHFKAKISDVVVNHHFDPTRPLFPLPAKEEYILFGAGNRAYMSRVLYKKPDMQFLVELEKVPEIFSRFPDVLTSKQFIDLGVHIQIPSLNLIHHLPTNPTAPLDIGKKYEFIFIQSGTETRGKLIVKRVVWFDYKLLNEELHHHGGDDKPKPEEHKHAGANALVAHATNRPNHPFCNKRH